MKSLEFINAILFQELSLLKLNFLMKKWVVCSAFFLVQTLFAQSEAILKGVVTDFQTGNVIPLASISTQQKQVNTLSNQSNNGFSGAVNYRYLGERPLVEDESVTAESYFILDTAFKYKKKKYEFGFFVENILDTQWMEAVFYDTSRLQGEVSEVEDFHFTPGTPFLAKLGITYYFD